MSHKIAVYGTLKQGGSNQCVMDADGGKYIGKGVTLEKFTMFGGYGYPRVVWDGDTSTIQCEVYEVDSLDNMDSLEGHPDFFERKEIKVEIDPDLESGYRFDIGDTPLVWMYFHPPIRNEYSSGPIVQDGYWDAPTSGYE